MEVNFKTNLSFLTRRRITNHNKVIIKKNLNKLININSNRVSNISDALKNINNKRKIFKQGYSFLLRVKNEQDTIKKCILDIVDIADEVIVVLNNSTDNTEKIVKEICINYSNVKLFYYDIDVPRYGEEHIKNFKKKGINIKLNTLTTYYNWVESKASFDKKIKWDGDFYAIRENLIEMINNYRDSKNNLGVIFSGLTMFQNDDQLYIKDKSYYDEYRLFLNGKKNIWSDNIVGGNNYCETSINFGNKCPNKFIWTKPIFYEIKNCKKDEFDSRSNSKPVDSRDRSDHNLMRKIIKKIHDNSLIKYEKNIHQKFKYQYINDIITMNEIKVSEYKSTYKTSSWQLSKHYFKFDK